MIKTIENFTKDVVDRNKKRVPDIREFSLKVSLSKKFRFDTIKEYVYEEYLPNKFIGPNEVI